MRNNQPVTQHEHLVPEGTTIISETDLKGVITYVNDDFLKISGFSENELMGKAHNIVRHPDMPEAGFADLWQTLKQGQSWTGLVKNRCKNGDFYWVHAFASPKRENGKIVGYISVRTKPTRAQVKTAEELYRRIREGKAKGIRLNRGRVEPTGIRSIPYKLADLSVQARILIEITINAVILALIAYFAFSLAEDTDCKTACKTFQGPGEKSVEKFPPQVVYCPAFSRRILECYQWTSLPKSEDFIL
ncbi:PAS domain-containing protein [Candidatus Methylospira mobilis]|uniref:PAS domain-containing protein n=1 Tax=Candidatus Methylospira mobilis TaxID=1808979 RepID=UPI0028E23E5E|nr:PAS domain-containing protein [Candidatus Methylospira mobilis]WNV06699.1 PAS domain-containing protein [Candidatus Methylospira mobilis]